MVSLVASLNHRLQAGTPAGVRFHWAWIPVVSLRSTTGYKPSSLRDEWADPMDWMDLIGLRRRCEGWLGEVLVGRGCRACRSILASTAS